MYEFQAHIIHVAEKLGWKVAPEGLIKKIIGSDEMMGCTLNDLVRLVNEHENFGKVVFDSVVEECLLRVEGSFVLMSLGYQLYEEGK